MTDLGAHVYGARGNAVPANVFGRIEKHLFRAFFVEPSTDTKKTNWPLVGRMWKGSGWEDSLTLREPVQTR